MRETQPMGVFNSLLRLQIRTCISLFCKIGNSPMFDIGFPDRHTRPPIRALKPGMSRLYPYDTAAPASFPLPSAGARFKHPSPKE
jgi:hypothetical protein